MIKKIAAVLAVGCLVLLMLMAVAGLVQVVFADTPTPGGNAAGTDDASGVLSEKSWVSIVLAIFAMFQALLAYFIKSKLDSFMTREACLSRMALCRHEELDPIHRQMEPLKETRAVLCVRLDIIEQRLSKLERAIEVITEKVDSMAHAIARLREWEAQ